MIAVFCSGCGSSVPEGSKFCQKCGQIVEGGQVAAAAAAPPQEDSGREKKGAAGFFSSAPGIILIILLSILVIGGLTVGLIFAFKGSANAACDAETAQVWEEYESLLEDSGTVLPTITVDAAALQKAQADLKKTEERVTALEKVLAKTGGTQDRRRGVKTTNVRDQKANEMAAALDAYTRFISKVTDLVTVLNGGNLLDPDVVNTLNGILAEIQKIGNEVKKLSNQFLNNNKVIVVTGQFNPKILDLAKAASAEVQNSVTAAQDAEQQRIAAEQAAAEQAAAAAEAARQRREAETKKASEKPSWDCGDPNCPI